MDISYQIDDFVINTTNRTNSYFKTAGGKGLNVCRVLSILKCKSLATGFIGSGSVGNFIKDDLKLSGINYSFTNIKSDSRNCISIVNNNSQTEILESGPTILKEERNNFINNYSTLLNKASLICISGSLPKGVDTSLYSELIRLADTKNIPVFLDTSTKALKHTLENSTPFLIKPNLDELQDLVGHDLCKKEESLKAVLNYPIFNNVKWVVVSLGSDGAFIKKDNTFYKVTIPKIEAINTVGCGDSTIAGLAYSFVNMYDTDKTIKTAMTTGILNALEAKTGFISLNKFDYYFEKIQIQQI
jgi:tagatose 6-phosphate kinase